MKFTFIHSLEELGTDLRVGVSLNNGKEIYYITGIDADNPDRLVPMSFTCSSGVAMGDLIGFPRLKRHIQKSNPSSSLLIQLMTLLIK